MNRLIRGIAPVLPLVVLVACGGGGGTASRAPGQASGGAGGQVAADEKEFAITLDKTSVPAGQTTFNIRNSGTVAHEFVVIDTDTSAGQLPQANGEVDEDSLEVVDEVEDLQPGATGTLAVNLAAGHYAIICNIPGHYAGGMHVDLTVQ